MLFIPTGLKDRLLKTFNIIKLDSFPINVQIRILIPDLTKHL